MSEIRRQPGKQTRSDGQSGGRERDTGDDDGKHGAEVYSSCRQHRPPNLQIDQ
jgi:hypothetical protein